MIYGVVVLFLMALTGGSMLYAEGENVSSSDVTESTGLNAPDTSSANPVGLVSDQDTENASDPSAFEGDSDSTSGERAPEDLPMSDTPAGAGVGIK